MNNQRETRAVSTLHAEFALSEAISRMYTAIYQAKNRDRGNDSASDVTEILMESAEAAGGVALELLSKLNIGIRKSSDDPTDKACYLEWRGHMDGDGPLLEIEDESCPATRAA